MNEDAYGELEPRRNRRMPGTRNQPRPTRSTRLKKGSASAPKVGGVHRRRNKHWNW